MGLDGDGSADAVASQLRKKLGSRGIVPKPRERLHVLYASGHSPWDIINIVPGFRRFADVTIYNCCDHGFDPRKSDWVFQRDRMNQHFVEFVKEADRESKIDLALTYYSGHHVSAATIEEINNMGIVTAAFHLDDRLYFLGEVLGGRARGPVPLVRAYDLNLTQAPESVVKYRVEGGICMVWPLAANPDLCYPRDVPFRYDVSLVGSAYGNRISLVHYLEKCGIRVATFGQGWPSGFIAADRFQEIYCASRINLNFDDIGFTHYQCGKIRDFEIPMCGALMLCTHNDHLFDYFNLDSEIFTFRSPQECKSQILRLLGNERLCEDTRIAARLRAVRDHTWECRARMLLKAVGFLV